MKNIFLSVVVVATLLAAGLGGTFAHFSDTEESVGNVVQVGSMDLKLYTITPSGGPFDDPDVPRLLYSVDLQPCESADFTIEVQNAGQPAGDLCYLYLHIKNITCEDVPDKLGNDRPEPEVVAEDGGWLGQVLVPGIGDIPCFASQHTSMTIQYAGVTVWEGKMKDAECINILLGDLLKCETKELHFVFHVQDVDEDDLIAAGTIPQGPAGGDGGYFDGTDADIIEKCWDKWPTNAMMKDRITFDMLFSLVQGP
ncbi:hypothetical protein ES703_38551 [subsurface metagenome]